MTTRHLDKFGTDECAAYKEIADHKWSDGYICKREGCGHVQYNEGEFPYSRRCLKCRKDESPTAQTVFDKLRMSLAACLELVRVVCERKSKWKIEKLTEYLKEKGYEGVNTRSVWSLLSKVYPQMKDIHHHYDESALFVVILGKRYTYFISKGKSNGRMKFNAYIHMGETSVRKLTKDHTTVDTKVALYYIRMTKVKLTRSEFLSRPPLTLKNEKVLTFAKNFIPWVNEPEAYTYKRNGNNYSDLMKRLTADYVKPVKI